MVHLSLEPVSKRLPLGKPLLFFRFSRVGKMVQWEMRLGNEWTIAFAGYDGMKGNTEKLKNSFQINEFANCLNCKRLQSCYISARCTMSSAFGGLFDG